MKYRHAYHAGNFADVHKHVTLIALLGAMQRKDKGFLFIDTHAGRGSYALRGSRGATPHESQTGYTLIADQQLNAEELKRYQEEVSAFRARTQNADAYPGSPVIASDLLRPQDRAVFIELVAAEARALERTLTAHPKVRIVVGDGLAQLRAHLPPVERRGLVLIDPPYEESAQEFNRVGAAIADSLRRFQSAVIAAWYPIKDARDAAAWHASLAKSITCEALISELWVFPCDSRVALNGSGLVIVNPPYQIADRMRVWLSELHAKLDGAHAGGCRVRMLTSHV